MTKKKREVFWYSILLELGNLDSPASRRHIQERPAHQSFLLESSGNPGPRKSLFFQFPRDLPMNFLLWKLSHHLLGF